MASLALVMSPLGLGLVILNMIPRYLQLQVTWSPIPSMTGGRENIGKIKTEQRTPVYGGKRGSKKVLILCDMGHKGWKAAAR